MRRATKSRRPEPLSTGFHRTRFYPPRNDSESLVPYVSTPMRQLRKTTLSKSWKRWGYQTSPLPGSAHLRRYHGNIALFARIGNDSFISVWWDLGQEWPNRP